MNKPGYTTTEFWVTMLTQIFAVISLIHPGISGNSDNAGLVQAVSIIAAAIATGFYSNSRAKVKVASGNASVIVPGPSSDLHIEPLISKES